LNPIALFIWRTFLAASRDFDRRSVFTQTSPKDDLKSVLETRVALLCYGSSVIDDDVEHFSLSLSLSLVLLSVSARTTVKRRMTNFSSFSFFLMKLRRVV